VEIHVLRFPLGAKLNLQNKVIPANAAVRHGLKFCILPTDCIYMTRGILRKNGYFLWQRSYGL